MIMFSITPKQNSFMFQISDGKKYGNVEISKDIDVRIIPAQARFFSQYFKQQTGNDVPSDQIALFMLQGLQSDTKEIIYKKLDVTPKENQDA